MADNSLQYGSDTIATDDVTTLNGGASSGIKVQRVKQAYGDDGTSRDVSVAFPLPVRPVSSTGTGGSVSASVSTVTVLAANANRIGAVLYNDSSATLYFALFAGASTSSYTFQLGANGGYVLDYGYTGIITGVWSAASGAVKVTELT